jgi:hypothetical protein
MDCFKCSISLDKRPCIFVYSKPSYAKPYCFRCAKRIEKDLIESAKQKYEKELKIYQEKRSAFQKRHPNFDSEMPFIDWNYVLIGVIGWLIFPVFGTMVGVIAWQGIRSFLWRREQDKLHKEFDSKSPMPIQPEPVKFDIKFDATRFAEPITEKNYRRQILLRDSYTCQNCEGRKSEADLEVHHIHVQSKGGIDHPTNLVTLCKPCHDREKWFGHIRKYPTTF